MLLHRSSGLPPLVVHVKPVGVPQPDCGARHVATLVLIVEPGRHRIDPGLVLTTLGLTPAESQVAVWLAADFFPKLSIWAVTGQRICSIKKLTTYTGN